jgi:hypothetical protein
LHTARTLYPAKRGEIAQSVVSSLKSAAGMAHIYDVSQATVSTHRLYLWLAASRVLGQVKESCPASAETPRLRDPKS